MGGLHETFQDIMSFIIGIRYYLIFMVLLALYLISYGISFFLYRQSRQHHKNRILNSRLVTTIEEKLFLLSNRRRVSEWIYDCAIKWNECLFCTYFRWMYVNDGVCHEIKHIHYWYSFFTRELQSFRESFRCFCFFFVWQTRKAFIELQ